jgi:hypothetical protein
MHAGHAQHVTPASERVACRVMQVADAPPSPGSPVGDASSQQPDYEGTEVESQPRGNLPPLHLDQRDSASGADSGVFENLRLVVRSLVRSAVSEEQDVCARLVAGLRRRLWFNDDDAARVEIDPFRRIIEEHRERSFEETEDLFLNRLTVAATRAARVIAPEVRLGAAQRGESAKLDEPTRWLLRLPRGTAPASRPSHQHSVWAGGVAGVRGHVPGIGGDDFGAAA